jgi:tripartite-type tricarboxylate transporter receptor subunit TctC
MTLRRRDALGLGAAWAASAIGATAPMAARAESRFPAGPIRLIIPTPPGGGLDALARVFSQQLSAHYGQPVLVESRAGANTAIAAAYVAAAAPDGLTLLMTFTSLQLNTITMPKPGYRMSDLAPIILTELSPVGFAVNAQVPAHDMREFIALAKRHPGTYNYATYGAGSVANFMGESLNVTEGLDLTQVPYKGAAPALLDLIGGQVTSAFSDAGSMAREEAASGRVRMLGVNGATRMKSYPQVPTFSEQGLAELDLPAWHGLFAPAATPKPVIDELAREMGRIIRLPEVSGRIYDLGFEPSGLAGADFSRYIDQTGKTLEALFRSGRIKLE